ncbi:MAG: DNA polymerase I [Caldilineaceae bacterium]|nr:DNA polymerase I [Caldilineaceae bacterium]MBP8107447.1 DNA polymerase I [Caldilineaceae bacterium]MBP8122404.1 DNA polymerase I [Caldilineaceae bacterium]
MPTLLLIDGHSQAYRAFFGVKAPLMTRSGEQTTAVYGFARKLFAVLKEYKPDHVAVAFDLGDTWRHEAFADYKATRDSMPDEMRTQIDRLQELLTALAIPIVTYPNYEADDVLGTLARRAAADGMDVLILTGDRDMFQLVDEHVQILYTSGGPNPQTKPYGPADLFDRYELTPEQFIDMKALTGDTSDNIPGIPGVGDKTAVKFLKEYADLDGIYANLDQIRGPKTRQNVTDSKELVYRNRTLVTIVTDLDFPFDWADARVRQADRAEVLRLFDEFEFRTMVPQFLELWPDAAEPGELLPANDGAGQLSLFGEDVVATAAPAMQTVAHIPDSGVLAESGYLCVRDEAALAQVAEALAAAEFLSFDVETTSTDAMQAVLVGLAVAWAPGQAAYIPVGHNEGDQLAWDRVRELLQPIFAKEGVSKIAHNAKYDFTVLRRYGLAIAGPIEDTMTLAWLIDPASRSLGLKAQAWAELGWEMTELSELIGSGRKQITMDQVAIESSAAYAAADADSTLQLFALLAPKVVAADLWDLYTKIERPLTPVLTDMEMAGIMLDTAVLAQMSEQLVQRLAELTTELVQIVGHDFNLRSTQQLSQVLFDEMGFPTKGLKKTKSGFYSTAAGVLEGLAAYAKELSPDQYRVLEIILEQRQMEKLRGTYVDALPELVNPNTGRLHTSFNQTGSATGRMSSSDPNLQNIPIRTEMGREIRKAFVVPPGHLLVAADYSQVELRVLAHTIHEESLIAAFKAGQDIHAATASRLFDVPLDQVSKEQRGLAKTINFATIYGVSAYGLSSRSEMGPKEAQAFLDSYFVTYPKVQRYITDTIAKANDLGYVETLLGRKRFFPELQSKLPYNQRQAIERQAINAPIQGSAADIIKIAMLNLHDRLRDGGFAARMLLQVHDELVLEVPEAERDAVMALVRETMESAYPLDLPLKVDVEIGPNWYDLEAIE